ncbi:ribonucleotide reductase inhibitor-domain-containing protein [Xylaria digitata]|nr:ribonucleotide reductase inhibitor-domain-containing protein [Xylaria digitata]
MSAPRTKRQFAGAASDPSQRQITSFFTSSSPNGNYITQASPLTPIPQPPDIAPNLPASVQANLLSVGMRIRKSVPEGYKTASSNAFALWDENDADPATAVMGEGQRSRANAFSSPRELLPFCGIHKVGGLHTQSEDHRPISHMRAGVSVTPAYHNITGTSVDDVPGLTSSQESVGSNASSITPPRTRKRFFVEDEEEEASGQLNIWRFNPDIYSLAPVGCNNNGRAMAVPRKGRLRAKFSGATTAIPSAGQENLMVIDSDFEEAEFLDRGLGKLT